MGRPKPFCRICYDTLEDCPCYYCESPVSSDYVYENQFALCNRCYKDMREFTIDK